ncbi:MAG TPA: sigma-70 family RNA polymerase sigma factor [Chryseolinea sp.]|nr:sigma-70 family RNA polymerase sigma factor [Chryseolinea sp.]HPH46904.1 sigma-70 family RNA polymerase sigma factor [Chryseolinea sp.]HPM30844.1 sigma-70 family RNA polymerase sigma factor [Chryseolinea sp.]
MTNEEEFQCIDRVLAGDQQAYAILVDKHKYYAFSIAMKVLQNKVEAEEVAQDAFVKAFHHLSKFNREAKFSTWLYRIVFNTAISAKRKNRQIFQSIENTIVEYNPGSEGTLESTDKKKYVNQAMAKLSDADRTALSLFYLEEFSLDEIAAITNLAANTIKVRIHRARQRMADELTLILKQEALTL